MNSRTAFSGILLFIASVQFCATAGSGFLSAGRAAAAALISTLAAAPFVYFLIRKKNRDSSISHHDNDTLAALEDILSIIARPAQLEKILQDILDRLISVPWIRLESAAAIFLVEPPGKRNTGP